MNPVDRLIAALEARGCNVRGNDERGWIACCPAHEDRNPSLSLNEGEEGRALLYCQAGCSTADVVAACGLELRDLFPERPEEPRRKRTEPTLPTDARLREHARRLLSNPRLLERLRARRGWTAAAFKPLGVGWDAEAQRLTFPIRDREGRLVNVCRYSPAPVAGTPKMISERGAPRDLFPAPETISSDVLWLVEGEPDAISATQLGLPAVGVPGVGFVDRLDLSRLRRFKRINVLFDCDPQGREAASKVAAALAELQLDVRVVDLEPDRTDGYDLGARLTETEDMGEGAELRVTQALERKAQAASPLQATTTGQGVEWPPLVARAVPPFPVNALPAEIAVWVRAVAEQSQTPEDLPALAALGVLSAAALGRAVVDCGGWEEELGLYLLPAMPSGDRKSTVLRAAVQPLRVIEQERREAALPEVREKRSRRAILERRASKLEKIAAENTDPVERNQAEADLSSVTEMLEEIGEPVVPRLLADDATAEALGGLLAKHSAISVLAAESPLISNLVDGRYSEGKANLHLVCAAYSGETTTIDRRSRDPEMLERPLLAITLVVQPHVLEGLVSHEIARAQGLVARFAFALPETKLGGRKVNAAPVPPAASAGWERVVRRVATAESADRTDKTHLNGGSVGFVSTLEPSRIHFAPAAQQLLTDLQERIEPRLGPAGDLSAVADWVGRHHGRVARIAALLHLCAHDTDEPVSEETMRAALEIGDYLLEHGRAVFHTPSDRTRRVIAWLRRRSERTVTQRDIHRGPLGGRGKVEAAQELIEMLEGLGILRQAPAEPAGRSGRPSSPVYEVHPDLTAPAASLAARSRENGSHALERPTGPPAPEPASDEEQRLLDYVLAKYEGQS